LPTSRRTAVAASITVGYAATRRTARGIGQEHEGHAMDGPPAPLQRFAGHSSAMLSWRRTTPVQSDHANSSPPSTGRGPSLAKEHFS
jgi:hypothetical protein